MTEQERCDLIGKLDYEGGLEYLVSGSRFREIKDDHFHKIVNDFVIAYEIVADYIGSIDDCEEEE